MADKMTGHEGNCITVIVWVEAYGADKIGIVKKYVELEKAESEGADNGQF